MLLMIAVMTGAYLGLHDLWPDTTRGFMQPWRSQSFLLGRWWPFSPKGLNHVDLL